MSEIEFKTEELLCLVEYILNRTGIRLCHSYFSLFSWIYDSKEKNEAEIWENVWFHHEKGKAEFKDGQTVTVNKVNVDKAVEPWRTAYLVLGSGQDPGQTSIYQRLHL